MIILDIYAMVPVYYNRFGDKIQDWDEYGKKNSVLIKEREQYVYTVYASSHLEANEAIERYKYKSGLEISKIIEL